MLRLITRDNVETVENAMEELQSIYFCKLLPLEESYNFHELHSPKLEDSDFDAKPMILLVGQHATGKTTFISYLLERNFPIIWSSRETTKDWFTAVMYNEDDVIIPGNEVVNHPEKPFGPLKKFGNTFLSRFQCSTIPSPLLRAISFVDTPGISADEEHRGYDSTAVLECLAQRSDFIILMLDVENPDISDNFRQSVEALRKHKGKIRVVLNKADMIGPEQLMRVSGAIMCSVKDLLQIPKPPRVYIGSFWDQPLHYDFYRQQFEAEEQELSRDLELLQRVVALRKIKSLIKRARIAKVHAYLISELRKEMPQNFGKNNKAAMKNLGDIYDRVCREHQVSIGDLADIEKMREVLAYQDFAKFHSLETPLLDVVGGRYFPANGHLANMLLLVYSRTEV